MKEQKKKKVFFIGLFIGLLIFLSLFFYNQNNTLVTTRYTIQSSKLPDSFDSFTLVQLSDLHGKSFGKNQKKIIEKISDVQPDTILFTGDLIDYRRYDETHSLILMEEMVKIAPVYYVIGNHEVWSQNIASLEQKLRERGVHVLRNETVEIENGTDKIRLTGIDDPANEVVGYEDHMKSTDDLNQAMDGIETEDTYHIMMAHRPELLSLYSEYGFDLVVTGHAHGGQFRIPTGGVFAPNQGFLPEYTAGIHEVQQTKMIVNRGLGNSTFPIRLFNRPEIGVITLQKNNHGT